MAIKYAFDLYPRADPVGGARVLRFSKLQEAEYRGEANGTGSGRIVIRGTETEAASIDPRGMDYIRVRRINTAVVDGGTLSGFSEKVVGGFFLENGDFEALTARSTKKLNFGGSGALSYLQRAQMWSHSYFVGGDDPRDGVWQDTPVNPDHTLGYILWRWFLNAQAFQSGPYLHEHADGTDHFDTHADDRTVNPLPDMTIGFDGDLDSDGNAWTLPFGALSLGVGASLLQAARLFMENGLYLSMDPDTFVLDAWEADNHGRDRTGVAWGASVIRFQAPSAATVATGNVKSDAKRAIAAKIKRSIILAGSGNIYGISTTGGYDIPWEGFYPSQAEDVPLLEATAAVQLGARSDAGDTVRLRGKLGASPTTGEYLPFEDALLDDLATLHTGTGQWDWNETDQKIAAITLKQRQGGDWDVWYDLGSTYLSLAERGFQAGSGSGSCTCIRLCDPHRIIQTSALWKIALTGSPPAGWHDVGFDDSAYNTAVIVNDGLWYDAGSSRWIWEDTGSPQGSGEERSFRHEFFLAEVPSHATLVASADNGCEVYVNGTLVGTVGGSERGTEDVVPFNYSSSVSFSVDPSLLVAGLNCMSIIGWNETEATPGVAGVYAALTLGGVTGSDTRAARCDHGHIIESLLTNETDTTLRLAPNGTGGVAWATGGGRPPYTVVVAADDTPADLQAIADYVCDGTADEVQINQAIVDTGSDTVSASVLLLPGKYVIGAAIDFQPWDTTAVTDARFVFEATAAAIHAGANLTQMVKINGVSVAAGYFLNRFDIRIGSLHGESATRTVSRAIELKRASDNHLWIGNITFVSGDGFYCDQDGVSDTGTFNNFIEINRITNVDGIAFRIIGGDNIHGFQGNIIKTGQIWGCGTGFSMGQAANKNAQYNTIIASPIESNDYGVIDRGGGNTWIINNTNNNATYGISVATGITRRSTFQFTTDAETIDPLVYAEHYVLEWGAFKGLVEFSEHSSAPGTPASGLGRLYAKSDGLIYWKNDGGTEYDLTASGAAGGHTIQDDGVDMTDRTNLNFGAGLLATDDGGGDATVIDIPFVYLAKWGTD